MSEKFLQANLLPHQEEAVNWCMKSERRCSILAYDMGLGKTVISCGLIVAKPIPTIIMVPTSLIHQWENEISLHTSGFKVQVYHGATRKKSKFDADIIITTTAIIANDIKQGIYKFRKFERWIIDEAHKLRNKYCKTYKALHEYAPFVKNKVFLTGTPICNTSNDIISLICLSNFDPYNDQKMWKNVENADKFRILEKIIPDVILRKTKVDTVSKLLPGITIHTVNLSIADDGQKEAYNYFTRDQDYVIKQILRLRQSLNHPSHVLHDIEPCEIEESSVQSIKFETVQKILVTIPTNDKIIIFSIFTKLLQQLSSVIPESQIYHGGLDMAERETVISQFKLDPSKRVLLINLRAGGVGLNLVEANHVILMEPYWNEAEQIQAINRVHRLGQTKPVNVYKLIVKNSIETWMATLQRAKQNLSLYFVDKNKNHKETDELVFERQKARDLFQTVKNAAVPETEEELKILEETIKEFEVSDDSM